MKTLHLYRVSPWLISFPAAVVLWVAGCATTEEHSFNHDYGQFLVTSPKYYIEDEGGARFRIVVDQGKPSAGAERVLDVKTAASEIAKDEAQRLGWKHWQLNYIQEKDQGWMHVVVAEVKHEPDAEPAPGQPTAPQE